MCMKKITNTMDVKKQYESKHSYRQHLLWYNGQSFFLDAAYDRTVDPHEIPIPDVDNKKHTQSFISMVWPRNSVENGSQ